MWGVKRRGPTPGDDPLQLSPLSSPIGAHWKPRRPRPSRLPLALGSLTLLLAAWGLWTGRLEVHSTPRSAAGIATNGAAASSASSTAAAAAAWGLPPPPKRRLPGGGWAPTLLVYVFSNTDPHYLGNLRFFVEHGMAADDGVTYLIVVQEEAAASGQQQQQPELPALPPNARYVRHPNSCYDWGAIGWVFEAGHARADDYTYFIFMNASVRGPFIPPHAQVGCRSPAASLLACSLACLCARLSCRRCCVPHVPPAACCGDGRRAGA